MRIRDIEEVIRVVQDAKQKLEKMNVTYPKKYVSEIDEIAKSVISSWYATYDPIYYDRQMNLKHAYKVGIENETDWYIEFGADLMGGEDADIVYENSFIEGYHGGRDKDGTPYWRTPYPYFTEWGRPAVKSFSPYIKINSQINSKIKEIDTEKQKEFDAIIARVQKSVDRLM